MSGIHLANALFQVSAFGLGLDFDEDLMHGIAREGRGDYYFISCAEEITKFMSQALKGIQSLMGTFCRHPPSTFSK